MNKGNNPDPSLPLAGANRRLRGWSVTPKMRPMKKRGPKLGQTSIRPHKPAPGPDLIDDLVQDAIRLPEPHEPTQSDREWVSETVARIRERARSKGR